jgi:hypothetical protein
MWHAIGQVTSWLTLFAFLVAAIFEFLRFRLKSRERQLLSAPEAQREALVQALNDTFLVPSLPVDPKSLKPNQAYQLLLEQIHDRARRFYASSLLIAFLALVAAIVAVFALSHVGQTTSTSHPPLVENTLATSSPPPNQTPATTAVSSDPLGIKPSLSGADRVALLSELRDNEARIERLQLGLKEHAGQISSQEVRIEEQEGRLNRGEGSPEDRAAAQDAIANARQAITESHKVDEKAVRKVQELRDRDRDIQALLAENAPP